jgi:DNA-binding transcriptional ArsR family regulator
MKIYQLSDNNATVNNVSPVDTTEVPTSDTLALPLQTPWLDLPQRARDTYHKILSLSRRLDFAHVSVERIAEYIGKCIRTAHTALKELREAGYIETQRGPRNRYLFIRPLVELVDTPRPRRTPTPKTPFLRPKVAEPVAEPKAKSCRPLTYTKQTEKNDNTQTEDKKSEALSEEVLVVVSSLQELGCDTRTAKALSRTFTKEQIDKAIATYRATKNVRCVPAFIRSALVNAWQHVTEETAKPKKSKFIVREGKDGKLYRVPENKDLSVNQSAGGSDLQPQKWRGGAFSGDSSASTSKDESATPKEGTEVLMGLSKILAIRDRHIAKA